MLCLLFAAARGTAVSAAIRWHCCTGVHEHFVCAQPSSISQSIMLQGADGGPVQGVDDNPLYFVYKINSLFQEEETRMSLSCMPYMKSYSTGLTGLTLFVAKLRCPQNTHSLCSSSTMGPGCPTRTWGQSIYIFNLVPTHPSR